MSHSFTLDFVITAKSRELLTQEVLPLVRAFLAERGLELSMEKTRITHIEEGFDFLGQNVRKYDGKLLVKPSKKSAAKFLSHVRSLVRENKTATQSDLIGMLNPVIRGWGEYHRHACAMDIFQKLDNLVWRIIWQWAKRRHPKKSSPWVVRRYFQTIHGRNWVFAVLTEGTFPDGQPIYRALRTLGEMNIVRHVKIKSYANPYDPEWEPYFEEREAKSMLLHLQGRKKLLAIWKRQGGWCVICKERITKETGWHQHHLRFQSMGGSDRSENLVLVHPTCHMQLHEHLRDKETTARTQQRLAKA